MEVLGAVLNDMDLFVSETGQEGLVAIEIVGRLPTFLLIDVG